MVKIYIAIGLDLRCFNTEYEYNTAYTLDFAIRVLKKYFFIIQRTILRNLIFGSD